MATAPYDFAKLVFRAGGGARQAAWRAWSELLVSTVRATCPMAAEGGDIAIDYTPAGAVIDTIIPVPETLYGRTDGSGVTAKNAATGAWGSGNVTLYRTVNDAGVLKDVPDATSVVVQNRRPFSAPANTQVLVESVGGAYFLIDYVCP